MGSLILDNHDKAFTALRKAIEAYSPISDTTWLALSSICHYQELDKSSLLYRAGEVPKTYAFVYQGLFRCFAYDEQGNEYNKNFFDEGMFPGSMTALLTSSPSVLTFEALEDTQLIEIDFSAYRKLMIENDELKLFQIYYLESNWLLPKDAREIEIVQEDATSRYLRFIEKYPSLVNRLAQYHIASHLGITPTQLSRIRKKL